MDRARLTLALAACLGLAACAAPERYTYQAVKQEFSHPALSQTAQAGGGQAQGPQAPAAPDFSQPLDLKAAIALALAQNPDQEMALARVQQSEAMLAQSLAAFLPMLSVYTEVARGDAPSGYLFKTIDERLLPPNTNFNAPGTYQNWETGLKLRWNLFHGGQDYLRRLMAQQGLEMSRLDRQAVANTLVASVIMGYYNCLAAGQMVQIAGQAQQSVEAQLKTVQVRFEGGGALKSDVLSLEVRLAQAREDLVRAQNHHRLALAALANLLGGDPDSDLKLIPGPQAAPSVPPTYQQGVLEALARRPELARVRRQVVSARLALDAARAQHLPRVDAQGVYYWDDPSAQYSGERANYNLGLVANWDIFTGLATYHEGEKARAALLEVLAADRKATQNIQLDVKSAYLGLAEALARQEVSRAGVEQAQEALKLVTKQYEGGAADVTRYLDAELNLNGARVRASAAAYDTLKAQADIARSLGMLAGQTGEEAPSHDRQD